jgi:ribonuclease Z
MELIFLGTSSALPTTKRNHPSIALKAFGEVMLFDCGEGTQRQMARIKLSPMKVDHIYLTHLHGDHFLGLPGMIQSMAFRGRKEPLHIYGPEGTIKTVQAIKDLGYYALSFPIHAYEVREGVILETDNYVIECCPTHHSVLNLAYSVEEKRSPKFLREKAIALGLKPGPDFGKLQNGIPVELNGELILPEQVLGEKRRGRKIVYSGDTIPCQELVKFASNADVLIHESTYESSQEKKALENGHSTTTQAAEIAKKAKVFELILTHISTRYKNSGDLRKEASQVFREVTVAEDFMTIPVERHNL